MNQLQEYELFELERHPETKPFEINDLNSLNWAFRKLATYKAKEQEITELANAERERIANWEEQEKNKFNDSIEFFQTLINQYHSKVLSDDPKAKTLSTPYGKSKARAVKPQPKKVDEKAILEHVVNNGMDEYIKPSLSWGEFKNKLQLAEVDGKQVVIDENGQVVPGIEVEPEQTKYSLVVGE